MCTHSVNDMLVTHDLSTSLRNYAVYFMSACTKNVQETSLGHPLYVFCRAGNSTFCPVRSRILVLERQLHIVYSQLWNSCVWNMKKYSDSSHYWPTSFEIKTASCLPLASLKSPRISQLQRRGSALREYSLLWPLLYFYWIWIYGNGFCFLVVPATVWISSSESDWGLQFMKDSKRIIYRENLKSSKSQHCHSSQLTVHPSSQLYCVFISANCC